jgi:small GTP-binding protein
MASLEEQIAEIEDELQRTPSNKATQTHIGRLKAKIAVLRLEREKRGHGRGGGIGYAVRKSGHATVGLVGYPSVGKSTLLTALTGAESAAAAYDFTTVSIVPGTLRWGGARIQILDMPGLVPGASRGRGRGREVLSVVRSADLILFVADPEHAEFRALLRELETAGVRVNARPPRIVVTRSERGGLAISSTARLTHLTEDLASDIAREFGLHNGSIVLRENATADQLVDALAGNRVYIPAIVVVNKADLLRPEESVRLLPRFAGFPVRFVSARTGAGLPDLTEAIGRALEFIRVFLKPPQGEPDLEEPVVLRRGARADDLLRRLPGSLAGGFRAAQVWGPSARFPGQTVGREHSLRDSDIVTILVQRGSAA